MLLWYAPGIFTERIFDAFTFPIYSEPFKKQLAAKVSLAYQPKRSHCQSNSINILHYPRCTFNHLVFSIATPRYIQPMLPYILNCMSFSEFVLLLNPANWHATDRTLPQLQRLSISYADGTVFTICNVLKCIQLCSATFTHSL